MQNWSSCKAVYDVIIGKFVEYFDGLLSDSEWEENNFKLHVRDKNNFIWWNQHQQNTRLFGSTRFATSNGTAFCMLRQESLVIFHESTAG